MAPDRVQEAEAWLLQLFEDLESRPEYKDGGPFYFSRICSEVALYAPELQLAVRAVLAKWLKGDDLYRAYDGANIATYCRFFELAPLVRKFAERLRRSDFPKALLLSRSLMESADKLEAEGNIQ